MKRSPLLGKPDPPSGLEAVHLGHLNIHQNQVECVLFKGGKSFFAVDGDQDLMSSFFKQAGDYLAVDRIVLCQQDA